MDIGSAIAVFLVLSIILMALFCFVTKYFHHKLKRALEDANEVYSMVDELCQENQNEDDDGQYDHYAKKNQDAKLKTGKKKREDEDMLVQMTDLKQPLQSGEDLYGPSALRRRLNGDTLPINKQESNRSMSSLKSFRPDKMNTTNRTDRSKPGQQNNKNDITKHNYVNKLVCYDSIGITTIDVIVTSIRKLGENSVKENKKHKINLISNTDDNFEDQLQIVGFEKHDFGCYKYETRVEISNMKMNEDYMIKSLKASESKQQIEIQEYLKLKMDIQSGL